VSWLSDDSIGQAINNDGSIGDASIRHPNNKYGSIGDGKEKGSNSLEETIYFEEGNYSLEGIRRIPIEVGIVYGYNILYELCIITISCTKITS